eukprot:gnl/Trimastix_PCT/1417.p1 GENE.gnl/Trimastix_PCT/1417~~gnl/Trimastix_PCT/1417.p1  ORF type:complete len:281 (+),score=105.12 gnl/Trimastix_PCT/1417:47-844(+)
MSQAPLCQITDIRATVQADENEAPKEILKGVTLTIEPGKVYALMGPNGSGKSTLAQLLAGHKSFAATHGSINFLGEDLLTLSPEERARRGLFIGFQSPPAIPGVTNEYFLRTAYNAVRAHRGEPEVDALDFDQIVRPHMQRLGMDERFLQRGVNEGFSGGERKRNELLQMTLLRPTFAILDEIDSGLDIDAVRVVSEGINYLRSAGVSVLLITHFQRILNYVVPDVIYVLQDGRVVKQGGKELALELEAKGYEWIAQENGNENAA